MKLRTRANLNAFTAGFSGAVGFAHFVNGSYGWAFFQTVVCAITLFYTRYYTKKANGTPT